MKPEQRKVLVTGAGGFIGSHLVEELVRQGFGVRAMVHYNSWGTLGWLDHVPTGVRDSIEIFSGDIRDPNGVRTAMQGCTDVLHLAALIGIPYSYHSPDSYIETNIKGTLNVLQAARDQNVSRVVQTSTSEVYGTALHVPMSEEHPLQGQSPYSATKIGADQLAMSFYLSFETPVVIARPFNAYGPRQSTRAVIPTIISQMVAGHQKIQLGKLSPTRDFNYVTDVAQGFIACMTSEAAIGEVCNLATGHEISIEATAEAIARILGRDIELESTMERMRPSGSEVERLCGDATKAREKLGWAPQFRGDAGFEKGLVKTIEWFTENQSQNTGRSYHI